MPRFGQKIGGTNADNTRTDDRYLHYFHPSEINPPCYQAGASICRRVRKSSHKNFSIRKNVVSVVPKCHEKNRPKAAFFLCETTIPAYMGRRPLMMRNRTITMAMTSST
jgi:hypothetical protein